MGAPRIQQRQEPLFRFIRDNASTTQIHKRAEYSTWILVNRVQEETFLLADPLGRSFATPHPEGITPFSAAEFCAINVGMPGYFSQDLLLGAGQAKLHKQR